MTMKLKSIDEASARMRIHAREDEIVARTVYVCPTCRLEVQFEHAVKVSLCSKYPIIVQFANYCTAHPPEHECLPNLFGPLEDMANYLFEVSANRGYQTPPPTLTEVVAKLHEEVSELYQAHCRGTLDSPCDKAEAMKAAGLRPLTCLEEECADIQIRLLMAVRELKVQNFADCVQVKDAFNHVRPVKPRPAP